MTPLATNRLLLDGVCYLNELPCLIDDAIIISVCLLDDFILRFSRGKPVNLNLHRLSRLYYEQDK